MEGSSQAQNCYKHALKVEQNFILTDKITGNPKIPPQIIQVPFRREPDDADNALLDATTDDGSDVDCE